MPLISGTLGAILGYNSQRDTNADNMRINEMNNQFNAVQAALQRGWQSSEAEKTRFFNQQEALKQREFSATEAQKVRDYEKMMSDTAYQRAFEDAKKTGLNPTALLLGQGGASTPSVSSASGSAASAGTPSGASASSSGNAQMKAYNWAGALGGISDGLASLASSAASLKAIKSLGTAKNVADVSRILVNAKTAKSIASLAKFLV